MKKQENRLSIGRINGVEIFAVKDKDGKDLVPIKPICQALGIHPYAQHEKVKSHKIYASVTRLSSVTGVDGKSYEMLCIEEEFVYGWLLGINPDNVAEQARDKVIEYQVECHHALYRYFRGKYQLQIDANLAEISVLKEINECLESEKNARLRRKDAEKRLSKIRASRLDDQPSLFD